MERNRRLMKAITATGLGCVLLLGGNEAVDATPTTTTTESVSPVDYRATTADKEALLMVAVSNPELMDRIQRTEESYYSLGLLDEGFNLFYAVDRGTLETGSVEYTPWFARTRKVADGSTTYDVVWAVDEKGNLRDSPISLGVDGSILLGKYEPVCERGNIVYGRDGEVLVVDKNSNRVPVANCSVLSKF